MDGVCTLSIIYIKTICVFLLGYNILIPAWVQRKYGMIFIYMLYMLVQYDI